MDLSKVKDKWDLKKHFYSGINDPMLKEDIGSIPVMVEAFCKKYKGKLNKLGPKGFKLFFSDAEPIRKISSKAGLFLGYRQALDTQDQKVIRKASEFDVLMAHLANKQLFIDEEFKQIGSRRLIELSRSEELKKYSNYFFQRAQTLKHILEGNTEKALNLKDLGGIGAMHALYEELTNSFTFRIEIGGKMKEITDSELRALRMDPDPCIRRKALAAMREVYSDKKIQITIGNIYKAVARDSSAEIRLRKYGGVMSPRNISEELDDSTVDLLLSEVSMGFCAFQKYLTAKAMLFGKKKLHYADLYAPIGKSGREYTFPEALDIFLGLMKRFDDEFFSHSLEMFLDGRVDVFPKKGKRGGAFASYSKGYPSFVLLNHTNRLEDVKTIAHELGHAMHGRLSQVQPAEVFDSPLCLAETASVFNELLVSEALSAKITKEEKIALLAKEIEGVASTIFLQAMYVLYERRVHNTIHSGKDLTYEDFNMLWREEQKKLFGSSIEFDVKPEQEIGWSAIPHIHQSPFYCYTYAFGNILTFSLYDKYKKDKGAFLPMYKDILSSGGSMRPYDLLMKHGIDIRSKGFYRDGLKVFEGMVDEFLRIV